MTYEDAVFNALQGKCVPYRKETKSKLKELLPIAKEKDGTLKKFWSDRLIELANKPIPHLGKYLWDENLGRNKMSKFNVGDKFEIEIAEVFKGAESGNDKYRIKGFDNLVFDDKGLGKMKQTHKNEPKRSIEVGDIVYIPEDDRCAVVIWKDTNTANVLYSDFALGIHMSLDRLSGVYEKSRALFELAKEIDAETRNIDFEAQEFAEMAEEM